MEYRMEPIQVWAEKGIVHVGQDNNPEPMSVLYLYPEQIDLVCDWLKRAGAEATKQKQGESA